jgi:hypothetical protein
MTDAMDPIGADQRPKDFEEAVLALLRLCMADRIRALGESEARDRIKYRWKGGEPF